MFPRILSFFFHMYPTTAQYLYLQCRYGASFDQFLSYSQIPCVRATERQEEARLYSGTVVLPHVFRGLLANCDDMA